MLIWDTIVPGVLLLNLCRIRGVKFNTKSEQGFTSGVQRDLVVHLFLDIKPILKKQKYWYKKAVTSRLRMRKKWCVFEELMCTVKPVYNYYLRDPNIVAVVARWSLFRGHLWDHKMVVDVYWWSQFGGGH